METRRPVAELPRRKPGDIAGRSAALVALLVLGIAGSAGPLTAAPVDDDVVPPRKVSGEPPAYTEEARRAGIEGAVNLAMVIDEGGNVTGARIVEGLGMGLDRAALDAVAAWKFEPATRRGTPVRVDFMITVNFRFDNDYDFGPVFALFLRRHPDFAALYRRGRFAEAFDLLDHWPDPDEPLLPLARAYVSLGERDPRAAWEWVKADPAPPPIEALLNIPPLAARLAVYDASSHAERAALVEVGLEAATLAVETDGRNAVALVSKARMLRLEAWLAADAAPNEAVVAEVQRLEALAEAAGGVQP